LAKQTQLSISNNTRGKIPRIAFANIKKDILGTSYDLSLAFVTPKEAARLAREYKGKEYEANVLSFRLEKDAGEMIICPTVAKAQAKDFDTNYQGMLTRLFIHGAFHLKGFTHGGTMEREERRIMQKYGL
jgi:probable rRNA maturation factor